jgi:hypothetical protein
MLRSSMAKFRSWVCCSGTAPALRMTCRKYSRYIGAWVSLAPECLRGGHSIFALTLTSTVRWRLNTTPFLPEHSYPYDASHWYYDVKIFFSSECSPGVRPQGQGVRPQRHSPPDQQCHTIRPDLCHGLPADNPLHVAEQAELVSWAASDAVDIHEEKLSFWPKLDDVIRAAAYRGVKVEMLISSWRYSRREIVPYLKSLLQINDALPKASGGISVVSNQCPITA